MARPRRRKRIELRNTGPPNMEKVGASVDRLQKVI
jgi:hypothetical protein